MQIKIDTALLDGLTQQAKASPRLRMNYDLRNSAADTSQRMLNAIEPGSVVPVHRHPKTSETMVVLRGRVAEEFYDDAGEVLERFVLGACGDARSELGMTGEESDMTFALNIPAGTWHTLRALESGTVILEFKDGAFEPIGECDILNKK